MDLGFITLHSLYLMMMLIFSRSFKMKKVLNYLFAFFLVSCSSGSFSGMEAESASTDVSNEVANSNATSGLKK